MTKSKSIISPKSIGIVAALVVPMLLIPTSGNAKSSRAEWYNLDHLIKVKQGDMRYGRRSERRALDRFFDQPTPQKSKAISRAQNKRLARSTKKRSNKKRRRGYSDDYYYEDDYGMSCVSPRQISKQLRRQGWRKFHNLRVRPTVLRFKARQRNGLTYNLKIDRCSGSLLKANIQYKDMWYVRWLRRISAAY